MFYSVKSNQVLGFFNKKFSIDLFFPVDLYISLSNICSNHSNQSEVIAGFFNNHYLSFLIYASSFMNRTSMVLFLVETYICHIGKWSVDTAV